MHCYACALLPPPPGTLISHTLILCQDMTMGGTLDLNPPHLPAIVQLPSLEAGDQACQVSTAGAVCPPTTRGSHLGDSGTCGVVDSLSMYR